MRDSRSSKPSMGSTAFDEPTYTMLEVQREVLGLFADSPRSSSPSPNVDVQERLDHNAVCSGDGSSSAELISTSSIIPPHGSLSSGQSVCPRPGPSFEVFEETEVDQGAPGGLFTDMAESSLLRADGGAVRQLGQRSSGLTVWTDSEFDFLSIG